MSEYNWEKMHEDLEKNHMIGCYGGSHSSYHALAELRAKVDMASVQVRQASEYVYEPLHKHLQLKETQQHWDRVITFDPLGLTATRPTIAATEACMRIPELNLEPDGVVVNEDGSINCLKVGIEHVWNLPMVAQRLHFDETQLREALYKHTQNHLLHDTSRRAFIPPIGGVTLYFFGDVSKLSNAATEIAVRFHDECNGSDVFGTDICTCRPYLVFGIEKAVECAQNGGVGFIVYFRKEGRALGEVTKFRVYNARKYQHGGDRPELYFQQTEKIAGIRDARFQELMPDVLSWLGLRRIDKLLSMSSDKYDGLVQAGVQVMQRVSLPDLFVPKNALVEITAKINAGYHSDNVSSDDIARELVSLDAVRHRCKLVYDRVAQGNGQHFVLHMDRLPVVVDKVIDVTLKNYSDLKIPSHSRWRNFHINGIDHFDQVASSWKCSIKEKARRMIDLAFVAVLLDAGAGAQWKYTDHEGNTFARSEGIAIAVLNMFREGLFSSDVAVPWRVNSHGLRRISLADLSRGFQISKHNKMIGVEGRYGLLQRLAEALEAHEGFFGSEVARPGHLLDYLIKNQASDHTVSLRVMWHVLAEGLKGIWPTTLSKVRRGDVWVYNPLKVYGAPGSDMIPFHKLTQWLAYSLIEPLQSVGLIITDQNLLTALPEYRNGGLLVDLGLIEPKQHTTFQMEFDAGSELVVEWRALTVVLMDLVAEGVRKKLGLNEQQLTMGQILEGGTWRAGRVVALERRPDGSPPIRIRSDGTVF